MTEEESENEYKQCCDLLVKRGFVRSYVYNDIARTARFDFTEEGEHLRWLLRRLFDVPRTSPMSITPNDIVSLVMVFVLTPPPDEIV